MVDFVLYSAWVIIVVGRGVVTVACRASHWCWSTSGAFGDCSDLPCTSLIDLANFTARVCLSCPVFVLYCPALTYSALSSLTVRSVHLSVSLFSAWSLLLFLLTAGMRRQLLFSCLGLTAVIEYPNSLKRPRTDTQDVCAQRVHVGMQLHE